MRTEPDHLDPALEPIFKEGRFVFDIYWQKVFCDPIIQSGLPGAGKALSFVPYTINFVEHLLHQDGNLGKSTYYLARDIAGDAVNSFISTRLLSKIPLPTAAGAVIAYGLEGAAIAAPHLKAAIQAAEPELARLKQQNTYAAQAAAHDLQRGIAVHKLVIAVGE